MTINNREYVCDLSSCLCQTSF